MFNPFKSIKTGTDAINEAIGQFEDIAVRIEAGVKDNEAEIIVNTETIAGLQVKNDMLLSAAARGESVAAKLRELIS